MVAVAGILFSSVSPPASACDTPVYRFAMYNWRYLAVYRVYYMYHGQPDEADRAANDALDALAAERPAPANVALIPVNVADEAEIQSLPEAVLEAWHALPERKPPVHLVFTPRGTLLHAGRLDEVEVRALVHSPARTRLAELLEIGHSGVLVVLTGTGDEANTAAEEVVAQVVERGQEGKIRPVSLVPVVEGDAEDDAALDVGRMTVRRDDPRERWFVRSLLQVESDLTEDERTMVFPTYGRGRVMEPYLGGGVTVENLSDAIAFLSGACSCEVKEQNPGMDLLTHWDWEATALAVAERYGAEEGNEHLLGQENLFPSILIAADELPVEPPVGEPVRDAGDSTSDELAPLIVEAVPGLTVSDETSDPPADDQTPAGKDDSDPAASDPASVTTTMSPHRADGTRLSDESFAASLSRNLGVIAAVACVALVLAGFFLMRPRN